MLTTRGLRVNPPLSAPGLAQPDGQRSAAVGRLCPLAEQPGLLRHLAGNPDAGTDLQDSVQRVLASLIIRG
jgi:hypothetical protein